jgi:hypothetical protein
VDSGNSSALVISSRHLSRRPKITEQLVLAAEAASPDLRLAGGAGLALLLEHRTSDDIELFCASADDVELIARALESEAHVRGLSLVRVRTGPTFIRFEGHGADAPIRVDVAQDSAPRLTAEPTFVGAVRVAAGNAPCSNALTQRNGFASNQQKGNEQVLHARRALPRSMSPSYFRSGGPTRSSTPRSTMFGSVRLAIRSSRRASSSSAPLPPSTRVTNSAAKQRPTAAPNATT